LESRGLQHKTKLPKGGDLGKRKGEGDPYCGRVLRRITRVDKMRVASGYMLRFTLQCGHGIDLSSSSSLRVGALTGCPRCK
jgi:hypothetical protein